VAGAAACAGSVVVKDDTDDENPDGLDTEVQGTTDVPWETGEPNTDDASNDSDTPGGGATAILVHPVEKRRRMSDS
jgi:hypothetical protein